MHVCLAGFAAGSALAALAPSLPTARRRPRAAGPRRRRAAAGDHGAGRRPGHQRAPPGRPRAGRRRPGAGQRARPAVRGRCRRADRLARHLLGEHPARRARRGRRPPGGAGPRPRRGRPAGRRGRRAAAGRRAGAARGRALQPRPAARGAAALGPAGPRGRRRRGGRVRRLGGALADPPARPGRRRAGGRSGAALAPTPSPVRRSWSRSSTCSWSRRPCSAGTRSPARCCSPGSWSRCRSARCSAGCCVRRLGERWVTAGGLALAGLAYLPDRELARRPRRPHGTAVAAPARHRPGARRPRARPGHRAAVGRRAAGRAGRPARRRVGRGRRRPDGGHAGRRRRADRLGPAPVPGADPGPGAAVPVRHRRPTSSAAGRRTTRRRYGRRCARSTARSSWPRPCCAASAPCSRSLWVAVRGRQSHRHPQYQAVAQVTCRRTSSGRLCEVFVYVVCLPTPLPRRRGYEKTSCWEADSGAAARKRPTGRTACSAASSRRRNTWRREP